MPEVEAKDFERLENKVEQLERDRIADREANNKRFSDLEYGQKTTNTLIQSAEKALTAQIAVVADSVGKQQGNITLILQNSLDERYDKRYANKIVETWFYRGIWLVLSLVIIAVVGLVIVNRGDL